MSFQATNFTVTLLLLLCFTVFCMFYRQKRPVESNVPIINWILLLFFTLVRTEDTFDTRFILMGFAAALMLRFEFMNRFISKVARTVEMAIWIYVLYRGCQILFF